MIPHQTSEEVLLSEARRYLAELRGAQTDTVFIDAFDMLWHHLKQSESPVPMAAVPISNELLNRLLKEFGRRAATQIRRGNPRAGRYLWRVAQKTPGIDPSEMWRRVGVSLSWYMAKTRATIRVFYAELMKGRLERAADLVFMPPYNEQTLGQVLGPRCRTNVTQGFVDWVEAEYRSLCRSDDRTAMIQRAAFVSGMACVVRSRLLQHTKPVPSYLLPYQQLDPLIKQLLALIRPRPAR
jgi:hypothetical protein